ncbi:hypothetical protein COL5a_002244 [Colletotrichum fioriniae]|uniref:uncharacterized protein n=1 Tax=Colletotrichum fioriniae TaxID=710243 RepID=UPI002301A1F6|nr:uncharacterized protein COL516b_002048 [Colletotrichum fioriniae]KAJ0311339.1 hypothetical protein COL516b_002048 [Colletotrichum fioriniae]KAJ0331581.1 hypothetical protein COL5a_002244 [Colletotrichum fioriniae]KAJ3941268.1 hypothetical protein N0V96_009150 [Colletotrichum fioriniae]
MCLRQDLIKPMVVDTTKGHDHTHTVVFLHRFPETASEEELSRKVLSEKLTMNHKTLREQFPSVRWVFPYAKAHARPWNNLTPEDRAAVGMNVGSLPYIAQIMLQEADKVGGLDRIILGGMGQTAEAAHDAMTSFPECKMDAYDNADGMSSFLQKTFHANCTSLEQLKLAGFVGMHAQDAEITSDVRSMAVLSKELSTMKKKINATLVAQTPHKFINGGYKIQTKTWDGSRIDDFASFLEAMGVQRTLDTKKTCTETLIPKNRELAKKWDPRDTLSDAQRYAQEILDQKKENEEIKRKLLIRIEADKVERKIKDAREKANRGKVNSKNNWLKPADSVNVLGGVGYRPNLNPEEDEAEVRKPSPSKSK